MKCIPEEYGGVNVVSNYDDFVRPACVRMGKETAQYACILIGAHISFTVILARQSGVSPSLFLIFAFLTCFHRPPLPAQHPHCALLKAV